MTTTITIKAGNAPVRVEAIDIDVRQEGKPDATTTSAIGRLDPGAEWEVHAHAYRKIVVTELAADADAD